jgi:hypothetical protein
MSTIPFPFFPFLSLSLYTIARERQNLVELKFLHLQLPVSPHVDSFAGHDSVEIAFADEKVVILHFPENEGNTSANKNTAEVILPEDFWT